MVTNHLQVLGWSSKLVVKKLFIGIKPWFSHENIGRFGYPFDLFKVWSEHQIQGKSKERYSCPFAMGPLPMAWKSHQKIRYLKWRNPDPSCMDGYGLCKGWKTHPAKKRPEIRYSESWKAFLVLLKLVRWNNKSSKSQPFFVLFPYWMLGQDYQKLSPKTWQIGSSFNPWKWSNLACA